MLTGNVAALDMLASAPKSAKVTSVYLVVCYRYQSRRYLLAQIDKVKEIFVRCTDHMDKNTNYYYKLPIVNPEKQNQKFMNNIADLYQKMASSPNIHL